MEILIPTWLLWMLAGWLFGEFVRFLRYLDKETRGN